MADANFNNALRLAAKRMQDQRREASYRTDPVAWAEDKLGVVLWSKQKEVLRSLVKHKRTAVKSCHSSGKTFLSGIAACWFISTREDCMVQSMAPTTSKYTRFSGKRFGRCT
jgi:reverse gyrase